MLVSLFESVIFKNKSVHVLRVKLEPIIEILLTLMSHDNLESQGQKFNTAYNSVHNAFFIKFCICLNNVFTNCLAHSQHTKPSVRSEDEWEMVLKGFTVEK